jgi:cysteine sulfinate desulfinase/cysteine desulfurase-like protein
MDSGMKLPVYLDYSATTPVDPRVAAKMIPWLTEHFGNPASRSHVYGWDAEKAVEEAREQVAALVGADAKEIIWTSGATESNNLAIKGAAHFYAGTKGKHIITVSTEHKAVLDTVKELERQGFEATYLTPQENGLITVEQFKAALRPDTVVASVMAVNNEIGVIQPIAELGEACRAKGTIFHVDAAQATGKMPIDLSTLKVDLMSFCAHKTYGPKGIGALYVRRKPRIRLEAQMHGGGHERGMRSGTLATHQIVGMGEVFPPGPRGNGDRERAHPHAARQAAQGPDGHRGNLRQWRHRAARAAQPQCQLQLRRRRVADHGDQGHRGVERLGLHLGQPGAILRAARAGSFRRTGAQLDPLHPRPLHHRGGRRFHHQAAARQAGQAARTVAAVGNVQGRR